MIEPKSLCKNLIPFFKTLAIYFALYGDSSRPQCPVYCAFKILPIVSLMLFVALSGIKGRRAAYSRKILVGLAFSCIGDACLVWKDRGYFVPGMLMFAAAQLIYTNAFRFRPLRLERGVVSLVIGTFIYAHLYPGLEGPMVVLVLVYVVLVGLMNWRAIALLSASSTEGSSWSRGGICLASFFFVVSDFAIGIENFRAPFSYSHQIVMVTYYAAQLGIAVSVLDGNQQPIDLRLEEKAA